MQFKKFRFTFFYLSILLSIVISMNAQAAKDPLIKAGSVAFATLDTPVNSDQPEKQVIATIIDGKFKGAELRGKLVSSDATPTQTILHFASIRFGKSTHAKSIDAYAIDFDAARTAIITEADLQELQRNRLHLAISFLDAYSDAHKIKLGSGNDFGILFMSNVS